MTIKALNLLEKLVPFSRDTFEEFLREHTFDTNKTEEIITTLLDEIELTVFSDMDIDQLLESSILAAAQNIQNNIEFEKIATRLNVTKVYKTAIKFDTSYDSLEEAYIDSFVDYIDTGIQLKLLNPDLKTMFDLDELAFELKPEKDDDFQLIGISTAVQRYMLRDRNQNLLETPQFMWMRIAMGLSLNEDRPTEVAKRFYNKLATKEYIPGGSTNIGAGTTFPVLSNCYLLETQDDVEHIFDNVKNVAIISKATGGIGISITKLRASGSQVKSNNTFSTGPIPFIKVMDSALKSMSRAGKKYGAMCIYMENWHINFPEFLDLKQNAGDDYRRIRTANTAAYISDEFMQRVVSGDKWYMFDPSETPELAELYGQEFSKKYAEYCAKADRGELKMVKIVPAREQMKQILTSLQSTSHPWLTWKDTINLRALNNNTGTIHCSNLCTEICLPQDRENIAVCNLAYINVTRHINREGITEDQKVDWVRLEETVRTAIRHLDNLIDVNKSPLPETDRSDKNNRAIGLGMMGLAETLELFGYSYDSEEGYDIIDKLAEFVSYTAIDESCNLAEERGSYANFEGSMWSKGYVPYDTIKKVEKSRKGENLSVYDADFQENLNSEQKDVDSLMNNQMNGTLGQLKTKIEKGIQNATSQESKELYEIFNQLTSFIQSNTENSTETQSTNSISKDQASYNSSGEGIELAQNIDYRMDWSRLRKRVKNGIRNATLMAIAPNASTGLVAGTSPGTDPRFAQVFSRNTYSGKFLDINHNLVKDLEELGIWDNVKDEVLENYGDISQIDRIPENLKNVYKTSFQISPYAYLEVASRLQKWIDQSLSRNIYLATRDLDEMIAIYTDAWRRGLKTTYYLHVKPRHQSEQSTIKVNKGKQLNKKGFGAINANTSTQPALPNLEVAAAEVKGFGFAKSKPVEEREEVTASTNVGGGFGFGKSQISEQSKVEDKIELTPKKKVDFAACPIDPAERAQCEACQ